MNLRDKRVVVTGGSRGLGLGLVEVLVGQGARVFVVARDAGALEAVRSRLGVETISADITDADGFAMRLHQSQLAIDVHPSVGFACLGIGLSIN